jgi:hypothetical protein
MKIRLLVIGCLLCLSAAAHADSVSEQIVQFCRENKDKQVGDGDCYDLAKYALSTAGARPQFRNPDYPEKGDYVWGDLVLYLEVTETGPRRTGEGKDVRPGDVIQFRDAKWEGKRPGGKGQYSMTFTHHTAVVSAVENDGKLVRIYHQNFGGKKVVTEAQLRLDDLKAGWIRVYRPIPKE